MSGDYSRAIRRGADASWTRSDDMTRDEIAAVVLAAALDDPEFANHIRDWRLTPCEHSRPLRYGPDLSRSAGEREQACSPCLRDRMLAHLLGGAS